MLKISKPSPAMVVALLALCFSITGAGYAASTINGKNIKKNTVTGKQVKNSSLTGSDIKNSSLTGADVKNGSLTPADVNLGTVASATNASHATQADNANTVGGQKIVKLFKPLPANASNLVLFDDGGLQIKVSTDSNGYINPGTFIATTNKPASTIYNQVSGDYNLTEVYENDLENGDFNPGDTFDLLETGDALNDTANVSHVEFQYQAADGTTAEGTLWLDTGFNDAETHVVGHIIIG